MVHYFGGVYYVYLKGRLILKWEAILSSETLAPVRTPYNVASQPRLQQFIIPYYRCLNLDSTADRTGTCSSFICPRSKYTLYNASPFYTDTLSVWARVPLYDIL